MSTETPAPFAPFLPTTPPTPPAQSGIIEKPESNTAKRKKTSKKKKAAVATPPAAPIGEGRTLKEAAKPRRKTASAKPAKRASKYDLQTILRVAAALKEPDQKLFEKLLGELSAMPKAGRVRVLKALNEVFG